MTVNTVSPGYTDTDMLSEPAIRSIGEQSSPLKRIGTPEDIADVVVYLAGPPRRVDDGRYDPGRWWRGHVGGAR